MDHLIKHSGSRINVFLGRLIMFISVHLFLSNDKLHASVVRIRN